MYTKWVNEIGGQYITDRGVPLEVFSLDSRRIKEYLKTVFLYTHEDGGAYFGCYSTNKSFVEDIDILLEKIGVKFKEIYQFNGYWAIKEYNK